MSVKVPVPWGLARSPYDLNGLMMRLIVNLLLIISPVVAYTQVSISPSFPTADEEITITYDATIGTSGLVGQSRVFMHSGVILSGPSGTAWQNVKGNWGDPASVGEMTSLGNDKWQIKITPRMYFGVSAGVRIYRIGMVFRSAGPCGGFSGNSTACKEGKTSSNGDIFADLFEGNQLQLSVTNPTQFPLFKDPGEIVTVTATASGAADLSININGIDVATASAATTITFDYTVAADPALTHVQVKAVSGTETVSTTFDVIVRKPALVEQRPAGVVDGINYHTDATTATLSLWAPNKTSVYVLGEFTEWTPIPMKKDGEHFWIALTGLVSGQEYAFQYLVNETVYVADPYADKILDPDDQYIPSATYPQLKQFPSAALKSLWYFNRLSILQTGQGPYVWQTTGFQKPAVEKLVVYELLVRDYFDPNNRNYRNLTDTIGYIKRLGANAIELMPIMEFNGNDSWGYNPTFMFAPDKYYGTKNDLKKFIDECHRQGIAVILDIAMNHQDIPNSYVMMDFDFVTSKPTADNKWFNVTATHPYSVFYDLNHESSYTKAYLDTINRYWLNEYRIDGFRFDLSKGFTQTNNPTDVAAWSAYDASRIAILERMADRIWEKFPDAYIILEHFAANDEEKELAEYRSAEGKGMLLWAKMTDPYNQSTMGYSSGSDLSPVYSGNRGWNVLHGVGYMESHDEERLMYKNLQYGNSVGGYNVKELATGLARMSAASAMFYTIPGPKMLWEFGELGYDQSINLCPDGTNNSNCRVSAKPVKWSYLDESARVTLFNYVSDLIRLKKQYPVFATGEAVFSGGTDLVKQVAIKHKPYSDSPSTADQMNAHVIANFDVTEANTSIAFVHTGTWFNYYTGASLAVTGSATSIKLPPGGFMLFTDVAIENKLVTGVSVIADGAISIYPNPATDYIRIEGLAGDQESQFILRSLTGQIVMNKPLSGERDEVNIHTIAAGLYFITVSDGVRNAHFKVIKE